MYLCSWHIMSRTISGKLLSQLRYHFNYLSCNDFSIQLFQHACMCMVDGAWFAFTIDSYLHGHATMNACFVVFFLYFVACTLI